MPGPGIVFERGGVNMSTVATLSEEDLRSLVEGTASKIIQLQDMDGVYNLRDLSALTEEARAFLERYHCSFAAEGRSEFTLIHKPFFEHVGPVFERLSLLPVFGSQRLVIPDRYNLYEHARNSAAHCHEIPSFEHFTAADMDHVRKIAFRVLRDHIIERSGGIAGLLDVVAKFREIIPVYDSPGYLYVDKRLKCLIEFFDSRRKTRMSMSTVEELVMAKGRLFDGEAKVNPAPLETYKSMPICAVDAGRKPLSEADLGLHDEAVQACINAGIFTQNAEHLETLRKLDELCEILNNFAKQVVGGDNYRKFAYEFFFSDQRFLMWAREVYFKFIDHYNKTDTTGASTSYFQALWDLHVTHVQEATGFTTSRKEEAYPRIDQDIKELRGKHASLNLGAQQAIEGRIKLEAMDSMWDKLFDDFVCEHTNSNKTALKLAWQEYLEKHIRIDQERCSLIDDKRYYGESFSGAFVYADVEKIYDALATKNLDGLISPQMLEPHLQQLLLFRPPLMVLSLLASHWVNQHDADEQDLAGYKEKIAVTVINHSIFDAAIVACLQSEMRENLEAFKANILDRLIAAAENLTTDRVICNRFAAQFFNDVVLQGLDYLPPVAKAMLQQASAMNLNGSVSFLLARLFKAICWDSRSFYPRAHTLEKLVESFAMIGLDDGHVLKAYDAYDRTLSMHMKTMVCEEAERNIREYLSRDFVFPDAPKAAFQFRRDIERHYLPGGPAQPTVYDQLFCVGEGQEVKVLRGHPALVFDNTIHGVFNPEGLLVFNNGRHLSTNITENIAGEVADFSIRTEANQLVIILNSSRVGFCFGDGNTFSLNHIMVGADRASLLNNPTRGKGVIYAAIMDHARNLKLDPLLQAEAHAMARVAFDYSKNKALISRAEAVDVLRLLAFFNNASEKFAEENFPGFAVLARDLGKIPNLEGARSSRKETLKNRLLMGFVILELTMLSFAKGYNSGIQDPFFVANYNEQILGVFNKYVLPGLLQGIVANYGGVVLILGSAFWSVAKFIGSFSGSSEREAAMREALDCASELDAIKQAVIYLKQLRAQQPDEQGQQLINNFLEVYSEVDSNLSITFGSWGRYKAAIATRPVIEIFKRPYSGREQGVIRATLFVKDIVMPLVVIGMTIKLAYDGIDGLDNPTIHDVLASNLLRKVMEYAVIPGGQFGLGFVLPILAIIMLLPETFLVQVARFVSEFFSEYVAPYLPTCQGGDALTVSHLERAGRQRAPRGYGAIFDGSSPLQERLLASDERREEDAVVIIVPSASGAV